MLVIMSFSFQVQYIGIQVNWNNSLVVLGG